MFSGEIQRSKERIMYSIVITVSTRWLWEATIKTQLKKVMRMETGDDDDDDDDDDSNADCDAADRRRVSQR